MGLSIDPSVDRSGADVLSRTAVGALGRGAVSGTRAPSRPVDQSIRRSSDPALSLFVFLLRPGLVRWPPVPGDEAAFPMSGPSPRTRWAAAPPRARQSKGRHGRRRGRARPEARLRRRGASLIGAHLPSRPSTGAEEALEVTRLGIESPHRGLTLLRSQAWALARSRRRGCDRGGWRSRSPDGRGTRRCRRVRGRPSRAGLPVRGPRRR